MTPMAAFVNLDLRVANNPILKKIWSIWSALPRKPAVPYAIDNFSGLTNFSDEAETFSKVAASIFSVVLIKRGCYYK